jgi:hypothetical protein
VPEIEESKWYGKNSVQTDKYSSTGPKTALKSRDLKSRDLKSRDLKSKD